VRHVIEHHGLSERRATRLLSVDRSAVRYQNKRRSDDAERALLKELAAERRRFGYRRLREMARRRGVVMNLKKVYRLYKEEGLTVRRRGGRKRAIGTRAPLEKAARPNAIWVLDFVSDTLESGRRFRVFNVEDQFTRRGLGVEIDTSLPGRRIVRVLDRLVATWGKPAMIVSDNGTELTCNAMLRWTTERAVRWHYIAPGKPMQNGYMESFNGKLRDECLNEHVFLIARRGAAHHRGLAHRLQRGAPAFEPRLSDAGGVRRGMGGWRTAREGGEHRPGRHILPSCSVASRPSLRWPRRAASLDTTCARRRDGHAAGTEEWLRRGRTKEWA
jgi:putative transposase